MKKKAARSDTLVNMYHTTRCNDPNNHNLNSYRRGIFESNEYLSNRISQNTHPTSEIMAARK
jgi:hypothetical protein